MTSAIRSFILRVTSQKKNAKLLIVALKINSYTSRWDCLKTSEYSKVKNLKKTSGWGLQITSTYISTVFELSVLEIHVSKFNCMSFEDH